MKTIRNDHMLNLGCGRCHARWVWTGPGSPMCSCTSVVWLATNRIDLGMLGLTSIGVTCRLPWRSTVRWSISMDEERVQRVWKTKWWPRPSCACWWKRRGTGHSFGLTIVFCALRKSWNGWLLKLLARVIGFVFPFCAIQIAAEEGVEMKEMESVVRELLDEIGHKLALPGVRAVALIIRGPIRRVIEAVHVSQKGLEEVWLRQRWFELLLGA